MTLWDWAARAYAAEGAKQADGTRKGGMRYFPVFLSLAGRRVLLVGTGEAAEAKKRLLAAAGAEIVHAADAGDVTPYAAVFVAEGAGWRGNGVRQRHRQRLCDVEQCEAGIH